METGVRFSLGPPSHSSSVDNKLLPKLSPTRQRVGYVEIKPSLSVAEFVNQVKGSSSHEINQVFANKNFHWQTGYGVLTLSKKGIPFVCKYIKKQKEHHKNNTTIPILEYVPEEKHEKKEG